MVAHGPTTLYRSAPSRVAWPCALRGSSSTPTQEQINRRAYELWQQAGFPSGRDEELAHQAEHELLKGQMRKYLTRGATP